MNFKSNILIVGGTGFIGYHLAKKSLKKGWQVTSISLRPPKKIRYLPQVKYIHCDITKKKSLKRNIRGSFSYVVNLGGHVEHSHKKKTFKINTLILRKILPNSIKNKIFEKSPFFSQFLSVDTSKIQEKEIIHL